MLRDRSQEYPLASQLSNFGLWKTLLRTFDCLETEALATVLLQFQCFYAGLNVSILLGDLLLDMPMALSYTPCTSITSLVTWQLWCSLLCPTTLLPISSHETLCLDWVSSYLLTRKKIMPAACHLESAWSQSHLGHLEQLEYFDLLSWDLPNMLCIKCIDASALTFSWGIALLSSSSSAAVKVISRASRFSSRYPNLFVPAQIRSSHWLQQGQLQ